MSRVKLFVAALLAFLLLGCGFILPKRATATPTALPPTQTPTATAVPTATLTPTLTPTPAPPPIAMPTAKGNRNIKIPAMVKPAPDTLRVVSHRGFINNDGLICIVGEVENYSTTDVTTLSVIRATLRNNKGELVGGDISAYLDRPALPAGAKSSFRLIVARNQLGGVDPTTVTDYQLDLWLTNAPTAEAELVVDSADVRQQSDGLYIDGVASNQTAQEFSAVSVYAMLFDAKGGVLNVATENLTSAQMMKPGQTVNFSVHFADHYEGAQSYIIVVTGWQKE